MTNLMFSITLLGGIILFVMVFVVIDLIGRRKDRQSKRRPAA